MCRYLTAKENILIPKFIILSHIVLKSDRHWDVKKLYSLQNYLRSITSNNAMSDTVVRKEVIALANLMNKSFRRPKRIVHKT